MKNKLNLSKEANDFLIALLFHMSPYISATSPAYELGLALSLAAWGCVPMDNPDYREWYEKYQHNLKKKYFMKTKPKAEV